MRLFLALEIPEALRSDLAELQERLRLTTKGWRWLRPQGIHLTIRFLGEVDAELDAAAREAWQRTATSVNPFTLRLRQLGCFPNPRRPRILHIGVEELGPGGALAALAQRTEAAARELGFSAERRPFRPHLTLARPARGARPTAPQDPGIHLGDPFGVKGMKLVRSQLDPRGAQYTVQATFPFASIEPGDTVNEDG